MWFSQKRSWKRGNRPDTRVSCLHSAWPENQGKDNKCFKSKSKKQKVIYILVHNKLKREKKQFL